MSELEYITCIRFSIQLMIAESVFLIGWGRKKRFTLRLVLSFLGYFLCTVVIYQVFKRLPSNNPVVSTLFYVSLFALTLCIMVANFQVQKKEILFASVCGYATQHIGFALSTIAREISGMELSTFWDLIVFRLLPYILIAALVYFGIIRRYEGKWELKDGDVNIILLALLILFSAVFLNILIEGISNDEYLRNVFCKIYAIICSLLVIFIAFYLTMQNRMLHEKEIMEEMLHNLKEQQKLSRENINIINIKCHDLKYRISKISRIENKESQEEYIESVKKAITIYDNIYQTGNDALDLVLMEKSLLCDEYNIKFSCMVDGLILNFIDTTDVYALFGNMMDNAIESVMKEEDEEKRIISMQVARRSQGVHIHIDNYCSASISFDDGLPVTTKEDKVFHGFGVKSIKYIIDKYKGDLLMQVKNHRFQVDIIF